MQKNRKREKDKKRNKSDKTILEENSESDSSSSNSEVSQSPKRQKQKNKPILHLNKIRLENFKSFEGFHEIGLFLDFSVVTGPNGSGKSNIIDALCFALGLTIHSLRTKNTKDLIYKSEEKGSQVKHSCYVELVFILDDGENKTEKTFKRKVTSKGASKYFINKTKVDSQDYISELEKYKIPAKARFFILAQGAIDSLLSKKNDLCETIELLSGSSLVREEYTELKNAIASQNEEINRFSTHINSIKDDRTKLKNQLENEKSYTELIEKINKNIEKIYLYRLAEQDTIVSFCRSSLQEHKDEMTNVQNDKQKLINEIKQKENTIKQKDQEMKTYFKENSKSKEEAENIKTKMGITSEQMKKCELDLFNKVSQLNQLKNDRSKNESKKTQLISSKENLEKEIEEIKGKLDQSSLDNNTTNLQGISKDQINDYRAISMNLTSLTLNQMNQKEKESFNITEKNMKKNLVEKLLIQLEKERNKIKQEINNLSLAIHTITGEIDKITKETKQHKKTYSKYSENKSSLEAEYISIYSSLEEKMSAISSIELESFESNKKRKITELINKNDKVYGFLYELITPLQKKLEVPIKVSLLKYLNYLVVENSETAKVVSEFLRSKELSCDLLVLENIPLRTTDESIRLKLGNLGNLMIDLIDCKKKGLKSAIEFFLKDMILCHDVNNIKMLKDKGFSSIIVIDGTLYKKTSIVGGNYRNLDQYNFNYSSNTQSVNEKLSKLRNEIEILSTRLKEIADEKEANNSHNYLRNKIIENENALSILEKTVKQKEIDLEAQRSKLTNTEQQIASNETALHDIEKSIEESTSIISNMDNEITEIKNNLYAEFKKKNKLKSLSKFEKFSIAEVQKLSDDLKIKEEKLLNLNNKLLSLNDSENMITTLQEEIKLLQVEKNKEEYNKESFEKELKLALEDYSTDKNKTNSILSEINQLKESIRSYNDQIEKIDKRIRNLIKNKIETEHKISNAYINKKQIIIESKMDNEKMLNDLGEIYQKSSIILSLNINIESFILKKELQESNIENCIIDYSLLERKVKIINRTVDAIKEKVEQNKSRLSSYLKEIEKYVKTISINESESNMLKSKEDELSKQKKEVNNEIQALIKQQERKKNKFETVKYQRKHKFDSFFQKLQLTLNETYKKLTESEENPGGTAYIHNSNEEEPYNGNVYYLPTPPGKRVIYDIDQLSGGEKTIAIISLLVSLQKISKTPFLILDEVDAYLDPEHECILEELFKSLKHRHQIIMVTHKSTIFRSAQALIGTYFNKAKFSSIPITLDMTAYN